MRDRVKFVSYNGHYPNLCSGNLVLEIDGENVRFLNIVYPLEVAYHLRQIGMR